jgi:diguanylate cyclase (GGDEF)-like protein/PAS domain S-box-containing protein
MGPPPEPTATRQLLYQSLVEDSLLLFLAVRPDGTVAFASRALPALLGLEPPELVGQNVLDRLHPDDVERAVLQISAGSAAGVARAITRFRVRHADGSWVPVELWANAITDGSDELIGICARDGTHQVFVEEILSMLLTGVPRHQALAPVCNTVQWNGVGSHVAIDWIDATGHHQVNTGLNPALGGGELEGEGGRHPWSRVRKNDAGMEGVVASLGPSRSRLAGEVDVASFWIEPVRWSDEFPPATVTIWTAPGRSPSIHAYGMTEARNMVELILRWTEQVAELDAAARVDPLTGLANRRAFFGALGAAADGGGAVLYCDLDRFKPVNDILGHAAGDQLLQAVSRRIEDSVRDTDLVARLGGDEFAVLCAGANLAEARDVAERIRASLSQPFRIGEEEVTIGISVGVGFDPERLSAEILEQADQELGTAKADRGR